MILINLSELIDKYLPDENEGLRKLRRGCDIMIKHHTYQNRAEKFLEIIDLEL